MRGPTGIPIRHKDCVDCGQLYLPRSGAQKRCMGCRARLAVNRALTPRRSARGVR
ncbi:hypothetical protein GCM10009613_11600 [Pseudonocardia kongjuensis]|uniref:Uncharacterized protein n=1 Tax=Pseudonocardia kongjuensis TaxID=102227 RepID=A0ABP4ICV2_9PSEU